MLNFIKANKTLVLIFILIILLMVLFEPVRKLFLIIFLLILGIIVLFLWPYISLFGNMALSFFLHLIRLFITKPIKLLIFNNILSNKLRQYRINKVYSLIIGNWKINFQNNKSIYFIFKDDKSGELFPVNNIREFLPKVKSFLGILFQADSFSPVVNVDGINYQLTKTYYPDFNGGIFDAEYASFSFSFLNSKKIKILFDEFNGIVFKVYYSNSYSIYLQLNGIIVNEQYWRPNGRCQKFQLIKEIRNSYE